MIEKIVTADDDGQLLSELEACASQPGKAGKARKSTHQIWDNSAVKLTGWKFNEWDYGKEKIKLPVSARGLFFLDDKIVIRGYDKFFNIDEVKTTSWDWIEQNSVGPYYLTLKENGCIVFLSGLEDGTLVVTSKHSTGPRDDSPDESNHSWVANKWVDSHLSKVNKTRNELANELYSLNVTAVGELCDDSFEEHILAYNNDKAGIYLHGLNANNRKFISYPFQAVDELAEKYGFIKTKFLVQDQFKELKAFLIKCSETGSWENDAVEGFVIRCKLKQTNDDFFFKYKFEEPYLMYREWREVTKAYINSPTTVFTSGKKKCKQITLEYLRFIKPILDNDPAKSREFLRNHGIIDLRDKFLKSKGQSGMELVKGEEEADAKIQAEARNDPANIKYALIPAATLGCGKTTLALALSHLTGFGLVQNDNYFLQSPKQRLVADTIQGFEETNVIFVDRNNHMARERKQIIEDILAKTLYQVKFICVNFLPHGASEDIYRLTRKRVGDRGDNHQTITGLNDAKINGIMRGFVNRFQVVNSRVAPDSWFDEVINLDVEKGTKENLRRVLKVLKEKYRLVGDFTEDQLEEALKVAMEYKSPRKSVQKVNEKGKKESEKGKKDNKSKQENKQAQPNDQTKKNLLNLHITYYNLLINLTTSSMIELVDKYFASNLEEDSRFWNELKDTNRVQRNFHITLVHYKQVHDAKKKECFDQLESILQKSGVQVPSTGTKPVQLNIPNYSSKIKILSIGYDGTVMALKVEIVNAAIPFANDVCHITIGAAQGYSAVKSLEMLASKESTIRDWDIQPNELDSELGVYLAEIQ